MRISTVAVTNLRSIRKASLDLSAVTPLIGPNGSGKSTWLLALKWFYEGVPATLNASDFFGGDWYGQTIETSVTFADLPVNLSEIDARFEPYVRDFGLTVTLRIPGPISADEPRRPAAQYFGTLLQHAPFATIRKDPAGAAARTAAALALQESNPDLYDMKLTGRGWPENDRALHEWEAKHPDLCALMDDDGSVFAPVTNPQSPLHTLTELISVPAVHDPADELEAAGSNLLNQLVRLSVSDPAQSDEATVIRDDAAQRFRQLVDDRENTELRSLGETVSHVLERYVPGAAATFGYRGGAAVVQAPVAYVSLSERGFEGPLDRKGSGLQRLFIVSLIEAAAAARALQTEPGEPDATRHRLLSVEEPELYQHPLQARRFAAILWGLTEADSLAQVMYSTHSPEFLPPGRIATYRLCMSEPTGSPGAPFASAIHSTDLEAIIALLAAAGTSIPLLDPNRLNNFFEIEMDAIVREGFFAQGVVLVEGAEDVGVIDAHSRAVNDPLESHGISVLAVGGKPNMTRLAAAFTAFGVPTYLVFDGDSDAKPKDRTMHADLNRNIQKFCGIGEPQEFPATAVQPRFAVFESNLTRVLPSQFPNNSFYLRRNEIAERLGWRRPSDAAKNANALRAVIDDLYDASGPSALLTQLHAAILAHASATLAPATLAQKD